MAIVVSSRWTVAPGEQAAVEAALAELVPATRREAGVIMLQAHRDPEDDRVFYFYEQYVDAAAMEAHTQTAHFERWILGECLPRIEQRVRGIYETWDP
ncbi:MAG: putative quinol monooxygenase [Gaiellales bacterium]